MSDCPICNHDCKSSPIAPGSHEHLVICKKCGTYKIEKGLSICMKDHELKKNQHIISGLTRYYSEYGKPIYLHNDNIDELIKTAPIPTGPLAAMDRILQYIERKMEHAADAVAISPMFDHPIVFAHNQEEFLYFLRSLLGRDLIEEKPTETGHSKYRLTTKGWQYLSQIKISPRDPQKAFVALAFNDTMIKCYEKGIEPALEEAGYQKPFRVDREEYNEKICDHIIARIRESSILVADFTGQNNGVYYEAGFASGLNIPVIWTCHRDAFDNVHFDTRQYNHIVWVNPEDLRQRLLDRIKATIAA